jgi:hypothetical protein
MLVCIKSCPAADVAGFAASIPAECRGELFPNVSVASGSSTASPTQTESSSSTTTTGSSAGSMTTGAAATGTTTHTTTSAAAASSTHAGLAAVNQPAGMVIAIGVLAAFAIRSLAGGSWHWWWGCLHNQYHQYMKVHACPGHRRSASVELLIHRNSAMENGYSTSRLHCHIFF